MQGSGRRKWLQAQLGTQAVKTRARARASEAQSGLTAAVALAAVTNGGWWLLWSRQRLGSAGVGSATAQAEIGMCRQGL